MPKEPFSFAIKRPSGRVDEVSDDLGWTSEGHVLTRHGIVNVHSNTHYKNGFTSINFIYCGRCYCQSFERYYTPRGLVTLADRFAREIATA